MKSELGRRVRKKREKDQRAAEQKEREAANKDYHDNILQTLKAIERQTEHSNDQNTPEKRSQRNWEKGGVIGLWTAAVVAIVAILITTSDTQNTIDASNRGWVGVSLIEFAKGIDAPGGPTIMVYYQNVGKSPAVDIRTGGTWLIVPLSSPIARSNLFPESKLWDELGRQIKEQCFGVTPLEGGSALFPFANNGLHSELAPPDKIPDMQPVKNHSVIIVAPGCITYRTLNQVRHTSFCQYATDIDAPPKWVFGNCPTGNFAN